MRLAVLLAFLTPTGSIRSYTAVDVCDFFAVDGCVISSARMLDCRGDSGSGSANATVLNVTASALRANASLASWPFPSDPPPADICDIVFNSTVTFLEYSSLSCESSPFTCQLFLSAVGFDILAARGVSVSANTISIEARNLILASESKLTTTGYGLEFGALPGVGAGAGGNNAGSGGAQPCKTMPPLNTEGTVPTLNCCPMSAFVTFNDSDGGTGWAYPDADWNRAFGGGGSNVTGDGSGGRSGGRLNVSLTGNLTIDGFLESVARSGREWRAPDTSAALSLTAPVTLLLHIFLLLQTGLMAERVRFLIPAWGVALVAPCSLTRLQYRQASQTLGLFPRMAG